MERYAPASKGVFWNRLKKPTYRRREVLITVIRVAEDPDREAFLRSKGGWKVLIDAEKLIHDIYEDRLISTRPEPKR